MGLNPHGGDHYLPHDSILDFSVNIHPLGFPNEIQSVIQEELKNLSFYPSIDGRNACKQLAKHQDLDPHEIIVGNGAVELIYLYARAQRGKRVCIIGPTFNEYERAFRLAGAEITTFRLEQEDEFGFSASKFQTFLERNPDCQVIVLCHPNNPTGTGMGKIEEFLKLAKDRDILVDESFLDFTDLPSFLPWLQQSKLFIVRSMTKFYSLAGLRIGYGCGSKALIRRMMNEKEPWTMNAFALASIPVLLQAKDYQKQVKTWVKTEKAAFYKLLQREKAWKVYPGEANFLLVKFPSSLIPVRTRLLRQGIYFRVCSDFDGLGDHFGRFTIRDRQEAALLIQKIKEAYNET